MVSNKIDWKTRAERVEAALAEVRAELHNQGLRAYEAERELAEVRGLLERCDEALGVEFPSDLQKEMRAYLNRTRPAAECEHRWLLLRQDMTTEGCTRCAALRPRQDWQRAAPTAEYVPECQCSEGWKRHHSHHMNTCPHWRAQAPSERETDDERIYNAFAPWPECCNAPTPAPDEHVECPNCGVCPQTHEVENEPRCAVSQRSDVLEEMLRSCHQDRQKLVRERDEARAALAEARGLLERCVYHTDADDFHCLPCAHCRDNIASYLDRTRAAPAQAPSGPACEHEWWRHPLEVGWYEECAKRKKLGANSQAPTPAPRCRYCDHEDPYHSPHCTRPAPRGNEWCVGCWSNVGIGVEHKSWCRYCPARRGAP